MKNIFASILNALNCIILACLITANCFGQEAMSRQKKFGVHLELNEAKAKIRTNYISQLTRWETYQKAIFESRGIGVHLLSPLDNSNFLGGRISLHQFNFFGKNKPFADKNYFAQTDFVFKSSKNSSRYSDVVEISVGAVLSRRIPFNRYFINYSTPYTAYARVGGPTCSFKWGLQMPLIDDKVICTLGFHVGYRSIRMLDLGVDGPFLDKYEFDFTFRAYQIGLYFELENWLHNKNKSNLNEQ